MISIFRYRGPNESGIYIDDSVALGHARLSIIGLDSGVQPIANERKLSGSSITAKLSIIPIKDRS